MIAFWLRILDLFKPLFLWQKINYTQLRSIIRIKLEMDNRRSPSFQMQKIQEEKSASFLLIFIIYAVFGGFISFLIGYLPSLILSFSIYYAFLMMMVTITLVSDFSSVLLDTSDNTILLPRPIDSKTLYASRSTHIFLYVGQIGLALSIFPILVTFIFHGVAAGFATIVFSLLTIFFSVSITNGLYLFLMRFASEERLKSIINYFQIGITIFMMLAYQVLPRLLGIGNLTNVATELKWWFVLIPPMWMAGATKFFIEFNANGLYFLAMVLSFAVPLISWRAVNKYLVPYFSSKISDLGISSSSTQNMAESNGKISLHLTNWITKPGIERAAFTFMRYAFARDRKLKLRIYPAIGSAFIIVVIILLQGNSRGDESWLAYLRGLAETKVYLFGIYSSIFVLITISAEVNFSDDYKSAWIFQSSPIKKPGEILAGVLKSIIVKFLLPLYGFTSGIILLVWRDRALADLVFGFATCLLLTTLMAVISDKHLPFSVMPSARSQAGNAARVIFFMILIGLVGAGHYFLTRVGLLLWILSPILLMASYFLFNRYRAIGWDEIR